MRYVERYDMYIDDDLVVYAEAQRTQGKFVKGKLYQLPVAMDSYGYKVVRRHVDGKTVNAPLHRIIAMAFIPNPENLPSVDHINRIKTDNRLCNLRWANYSIQESNKDRTEKSRKMYGGLQGKKFDADGNPVHDDETREHSRMYRKFHLSRAREIDRERYQRKHDERLLASNAGYGRKRLTMNRVRFADGSVHWVEREKAMELFELPVCERVFN